MTDATLGHNRPPADANPLRDRLAEAHAAMVARQAALLEALKRAPETVDDANAGRVTDFVKQIAAATKAMDTARIAEKEPYLAGGRTVDTFFKRLADPLDKAKGTLTARLTTYERAKAAEERRFREEAARKEREEALRLRREAEEREQAAQTDVGLEEAVRGRQPPPAKPMWTPSPPKRPRTSRPRRFTRLAATTGRPVRCGPFGISRTWIGPRWTSKPYATTSRAMRWKKRFGRTSKPTDVSSMACAYSRTQGASCDDRSAEADLGLARPPWDVDTNFSEDPEDFHLHNPPDETFYVRADIADERLAALEGALSVMRQQNVLMPVNQEDIDITMERMWDAIAQAEPIKPEEAK